MSCYYYGVIDVDVLLVCIFFFKQKTAYEMRISDWSSDVCSSDLILQRPCRSDAVVVRWRAQRSVMSAAWVVNGAIAIRRLRGGHRVALKVAIARTGTLQPTARFGAWHISTE